MSTKSHISRPRDMPKPARGALEAAGQKHTPQTLSRTPIDDKTSSRSLIGPTASVKISSRRPTVALSLPSFSLQWPPVEGEAKDISPASLRESALPTGWVSLLKPRDNATKGFILAFIISTENKYGIAHLIHGWLPQTLVEMIKIRKPRATKKSGAVLPTAILVVPTPRHYYLWYRFEQSTYDRFLRLYRPGAKSPNRPSTAEEIITDIKHYHARITISDDRPREISSPPEYLK